MPSISFECPHCHKTIKAPASSAGTDNVCPSCRGLLRVPEISVGTLIPDPPIVARPPAKNDPGPDPFHASDMMRPVLLAFFFPSFLGAMLGGMFLVITLNTVEGPGETFVWVAALFKSTFWSAMGLILIDIERAVRKAG